MDACLRRGVFVAGDQTMRRRLRSRRSRNIVKPVDINGSPIVHARCNGDRSGGNPSNLTLENRRSKPKFVS